MNPDNPPIDWSTADVQRRIKAGRRQGLARAVGLDRWPRARVLDATAGLGRDAYVLAALGAEVELAERIPQLQIALADALARAPTDIAARMALFRGDAAELMARPGAGWDVVLLDPMFPDRGKRALPKQQAQWLRQVAGEDDDADRLLPLAIAVARRRVVVKRAPKAPHLAGRVPAFGYDGSRTRFDIYVGTAVDQESPDA